MKHRLATVTALLLLGTGCLEGVTQVAGVGAVYTTACSAEMEVKGVEYTTRCTPPPCADTFDSVSVSDVVVALDPGRKVVGYKERVCVQDLSNASAMFSPALNAELEVPEPDAPEPAPSPVEDEAR